MSPRAIALVLAGGLLAACAALPPAQLVDRGLGQLEARQYAEALESFEAAGKGAPADAEAAFLQGAALNRLERWADALARLDRAQSMDLRRPDAAFERGLSLLGLKRYAEAEAQLEQYERAMPGSGKSSELLGRAYLGQGDHDRAAARFTEAMERDGALVGRSLFFLALIETARGRPAEAEKYLETLSREVPGSRYARGLAAAPAEP